MNRRQFLCSVPALAGLPAWAAPRAPNVVIILCDDLGYADVGVYGSPIKTPNLNRMAAEGTRFTHFTSANPVCSPSRAAWMTGRYPPRAAVPQVLFPPDTTGLPDTETTIAQVLKEKNYETMCVGKWHLGHLPQYLPMRRGFDEYFGIPYSNDMTPRVLLYNGDIVEKTATLETLTQRYTQQAVRFLESSKDSPFFLTFRWQRRHAFAASRRRGSTATRSRRSTGAWEKSWAR